jgi:rubrerythrin
MAQFIDPFVAVVPDRKLTLRELTHGIRMALAAEEEATHLYEALADATDEPLARKVLLDIANEERVHVGEFQRLLNILLPDEEGFLERGAGEVNVMQAEVRGGGASVSKPSESVPAVGSLKS